MKEDCDSAGSVEQALLKEIAAMYPHGMPNLYRTLLHNPAALSGFIALDAKLGAHGCLSPKERILVGLITAREAGCSYCKAALSTEARAAGAPDETINAIIENDLPDDSRSQVLAQATARLLELSGRLPKAEIAYFRQRGLSESDLLEVISVVGLFTIATYANNLMRTRIDPEYREAEAPDDHD